jgi:hypothetical protein
MRAEPRYHEQQQRGAGPPNEETTTLSTDLQAKALVRGIVSEVGDGSIVLELPHTDYRLRLRLESSVAAPEAGRRVSGIIEGDALRIHAAEGGGRFIEPAWGEPRIVAGTVLAVDAEQGRVLVDVAAPIWLRAQVGQDFEVIAEGGLVNCYVASGATFTPVTDAGA